MIAKIWSIVVQSGCLDDPMSEAYVAAAAFAFWIGLFTLLASQHSPWRSYLFKNASPPSPFRINTWASLPVYLGGIKLLHLVKEKTKSIHDSEAPTLHRLMIELVLGIFAYDAIWWLIHVSIHHFPTLTFCAAHETHHSAYISAAGTVHHSFTDGALQVIVNIIVQHLSPWGWACKHAMSRTLHNIVITYMLVEIHSEFDAPWSMHNIAPSIFGGALRHRYHHAYNQKGFQGRRGVHYHEFFKFFDDLAGYAVADKECRDVCFPDPEDESNNKTDIQGDFEKAKKKAKTKLLK